MRFPGEGRMSLKEFVSNPPNELMLDTEIEYHIFISPETVYFPYKTMLELIQKALELYAESR